jgi:hypothetical protein
MITRKGFTCFSATVALGILCAVSAFGAYNAPIDYRQTMTIVIREADVDDWSPVDARYFEEVATSPDGYQIAFLAHLSSYPGKAKHLYLANGNGSGLVDLTDHLPEGINVDNVYYLRFSGNGSKLFFFGNYGADVIYCDTVTANKSCSSAFAGPIYGDPREPFSVNNGGTRLYFKHDTGWDDVAKKYRRGLFWAGIGYPAVELMNIDELPGSQNMNLLRYLGSSEKGTLLFTWVNTDSPAPAQTSMYEVGIGDLPSRMPQDESHTWVWDAQDLRNRLIDINGNWALYAYVPLSGQPQELYRLNLRYGTKWLILTTTDGNGFHGGPALSPTGSIALVKTIGYNQTRIDLADMATRDTSTQWFTEAGCSGAERISDIATYDRYYFMASACGSGDPAKIFRVDMKPGSNGKVPNIDSIKFNRRYLPFNDTATLTVTAKVQKASQTHKAIEWVKMKSLVEGRESPEWLVNEPLTYDPVLYDDGTHGDVEAGDGIYTNNTIRSQSVSNFYTRYTLPHYVGVRVVAKDVDDNYALADTHISVSDDPLPTVRITVPDPNAAESGDPGRFIVSRLATDRTEDSLTVKYSVSGSATAGQDYVALSGSVTIQAGLHTAGIIVKPKDDDLMEGVETVTATLTPDAAYILGSPASGTVEIGSNERVTITAADPTASEDGLTTGRFVVKRTGSTSAPLIVGYSVAGTATPGSDYLALSGTVTIPAEASTKTIMVRPLDDQVEEGNESVKVTLSQSSKYTLGAEKTATVRIISDE